MTLELDCFNSKSVFYPHLPHAFFLMNKSHACLQGTYTLIMGEMRYEHTNEKDLSDNTKWGQFLEPVSWEPWLWEPLASSSCQGRAILPSWYGLLGWLFMERAL